MDVTNESRKLDARYLKVIISFLVVKFSFCLSNDNVNYYLVSIYTSVFFMMRKEFIQQIDTQILTVIHL